MNKQLVQVDNLSFWINGIPILKNISLSIKQGEIVSLIGMNGAGKTTLLRCILGQYSNGDPTLFEGKVFFSNQNINKKKTHQIVGMGLALVPEGRRLFYQQSVQENLTLGSYCLPTSAKKSKKNYQELREWIYELFPILAERRNNLASELSGGEQQMLAIARALMSRPRCLILDEPTLGLAPQIIDKVFSVLNLLKKDLAILLVEQNVFLSLTNSDRGYVIENGKIVLTGKSSNLLNNPDIKKLYLGLITLT